MLITIDKRGSINLPADVRKSLGLQPGTHLDLQVVEGGTLLLNPVVIYPTLRLNEKGIDKLREARESGTGQLPEWLIEEMRDAGTHPE
jgi:AbrB family looped-hinge helix DNA binding protein